MMTHLGHQCWGSADGLSISLRPSGWWPPSSALGGLVEVLVEARVIHGR